MSSVKEVVFGAQIIVIGMLAGAGMYESLVLAPNIAANIPDSLEHARLFWSEANPGNYFRIFAPAAQILTLVCILLNWRTPKGRRWWLVAALLCLVVADIVTFTFHYPRNDFLFSDPLNTDVTELGKAAIEWGRGNWLRVVLSLAALIASLVAFSRKRTAA